MNPRKKLGHILVEAGIITTTTLDRALKRQQGTDRRIGAVLESMGVITEQELAEALAKQSGYQTANGFSGFAFEKSLLNLVPDEIAICKMVFPLKRNETTLALAINDPSDTQTIEHLSSTTGLKIMPVLAARREIHEAIKRNYMHPVEGVKIGKQILVVEDSQAVSLIIKGALEKEGFGVIIAMDGLDALKKALTEKPDLIISDSMMPKMDGYSLMRALKANRDTAGIPVILLTSKASGEDEQKALEMGFLDFVSKPVQPARLTSRVKRAFLLIEKFKQLGGANLMDFSS